MWIGIKTSGPEAFKTTYKEETLLNDTSMLVFPHVYKGTCPLFKPQIMNNSWAHELWSAVDKKTQLSLLRSVFTGFLSVLLISSITVILESTAFFSCSCFHFFYLHNFTFHLILHSSVFCILPVLYCVILYCISLFMHSAFYWKKSVSSHL